MVTITYVKQYVGGVLDGCTASGCRIVLPPIAFKVWRDQLETVQIDDSGFRYLVISYTVSGY